MGNVRRAGRLRRLPDPWWLIPEFTVFGAALPWPLAATLPWAPRSPRRRLSIHFWIGCSAHELPGFARPGIARCGVTFYLDLALIVALLPALFVPVAIRCWAKRTSRLDFPRRVLATPIRCRLSRAVGRWTGTACP